ncbi:MAG: ribosome small subunit-dependent GTPase A [Burkholderiaceae bacterium]|nr:ribosome small subunit-dependent GTPase A [Burkholderiaceae bacterium]
MSAMRARLLSHHGRQAWVLDDQGQAHLCVFRGRELTPAANDWIEVDTSVQPAVITAIYPRTNDITRSEAHRSKTLAANIDQAVIVISGAPLFSDELLARMICACAAQDVPGLIVMNKTDLVDDTARATAQLSVFGACIELLGWRVIRIAARPSEGDRTAVGCDALRSLLAGKATLIMGQSGMGKSSLMNALVPGLNAQTREISQALQTGKHTTTVGQVVRYDQDSWLIDTPGFQLFGLHHLSISQLALGFPEWQAVHERDGRCHYANCTHDLEPNCTVRSACLNDKAASRRLELWKMLRASL